MRVPADCILIEGIDITCDEASMTGEADHVDKHPIDSHNFDQNLDPFLLGKTLVCTG
jgi:magnesium-transporting ATPase (P-type)